MLIEHVPQFIFKTEKPLAEFSEQVVESCHQKFAQMYRWYAVKEVESVRHGKKFHKAVLHFNSFNDYVQLVFKAALF